MFLHFPFSVILHSFCMIPAKCPYERFPDFPLLSGGPYKNIKLGSYCITSTVWTQSSYRLLNIKYTSHALDVWLVFSPFPHCVSAPQRWCTAGSLLFHHPLALLLWLLLGSASQCTDLVAAAHGYGTLSLQPTDPADAATVPWLLEVVWNCFTSWYHRRQTTVCNTTGWLKNDYLEKLWKWLWPYFRH